MAYYTCNLPVIFLLIAVIMIIFQHFFFLYCNLIKGFNNGAANNEKKMYICIISIKLIFQALLKQPEGRFKAFSGKF